MSDEERTLYMFVIRDFSGFIPNLELDPIRHWLYRKGGLIFSQAKTGRINIHEYRFDIRIHPRSVQESFRSEQGESTISQRGLVLPCRPCCTGLSLPCTGLCTGLVLAFHCTLY